MGWLQCMRRIVEVVMVLCFTCEWQQPERGAGCFWAMSVQKCCSSALEKSFLKQELLCVCSTWCMEVSSFSSPSHFPILFFLKEENEVPEIHFPLPSPYQQMGSSQMERISVSGRGRGGPWQFGVLRHCSCLSCFAFSQSVQCPLAQYTYTLHR